MIHCRTGAFRGTLAGLAFFAVAGFTGHMAWAGSDLVAGPMIGHVTDHSARIWLQLSVAKQVTVTCTEDRGAQVSQVGIDAEGPLPFTCDIPINNLKPNKNYRIQMQLDGQPLNIPGPELVIRTPPPPGEEAPFTIAFGGGIETREKRSAPIFKAISALDPRALLFLGNTVFLPDKQEQYPQRYREAVRFIADAYSQGRQDPELQELFRTTACYAIWGERDFGIAGADKTWIFKEEAWSAFQHFWPNPDWGTPENPGCYFRFTIGDVDFFMLDSRMYRDGDSDPARKTMLGQRQMEWLKTGLTKSRATFKIIASASQLLADETEEGCDIWARYQPEQKDFLQWLFSNRISGAVFISASARAGEITALNPADVTGRAPAAGIAGASNGYPLFELTTAGLAEKSPDDAQPPINPARQGQPITGNQFGTLDFGGLRDHRFITLRLRDETGHIKLEQTLFAVQLKH